MSLIGKRFRIFYRELKAFAVHKKASGEGAQDGLERRSFFGSGDAIRLLFYGDFFKVVSVGNVVADSMGVPLREKGLRHYCTLRSNIHSSRR